MHCAGSQAINQCQRCGPVFQELWGQQEYRNRMLSIANGRGVRGDALISTLIFNSLLRKKIIMGSGEHWDAQTAPRRGIALPVPSLPFQFLLTSRSVLFPSHVDPLRRSLAIRQRVLEPVVDRVQAYPVLGPREGADRRPAGPRLCANIPAGDRVLATTPPVHQPTSTITAIHHFHLLASLAADGTRSSGDSRSETGSMPAIFPGSGSPATTTTTTTATATAATAESTASGSAIPASSSAAGFPSVKSLTKKLSAPQLAQPSASNSSSTADPKQPSSPSSSTLNFNSLSQRFKPKGDGSNNNPSGKDQPTDEPPRTSIFRRLSPGLAARVKLLDGSARNSSVQQSRSRSPVGRIPVDQIRELDNLHQDLSIKVEKRGRAWAGSRSLIKRERSAPSLLNLQTTTKDKEEDAVPSIASPTAASTVTVGSSSYLDPVVSTPTSTTQEFAVNTSPGPDHNYTDASVSHGGAAPAMAAVEPVMAPQGESNSTSNGIEPMEGSTDLEEYLKRSTLEDSDQPPPPPPKDTPPAPSTPSATNVQSYFNPLGLHRAESIYSFSRASFSNQLSQLTSINLPQPSSLESSITSIPTAPAAVKALNGAAEQIQKWINKAAEVLSGMDAEDDVEWAAAGGREGLDEVDKAVTKFESLVNVYVKAIENVQLREDIGNVTAEDLKTIVSQMESTLKNWAQIRSQLKGVKEQVELAMEWEELWTVVLGDVGLEIDDLSRLVFEMEENRHKTLAEQDAEPSSGLDINELETIVEESPFHATASSTKRFSLLDTGSSFDASTAATTNNPQDDANLMQLFARMQPLRASLDFLPMRLSMFQSRAEKVFPTACQELEDRRQRLEKSYKKLETDAENLRRELGEDRWILVFRNAGRQAQKMCESVERSIGKLQESLETGDHVNNPTAIMKKIESYEAKKIHYIPAIDRVLSIIQKGVNDRLTVNGEILTLLSDMKSRVDALKASMKVMDGLLEETPISKSQQLRDSISSIITMDSPATGSAIATPGSSPASSVIIGGNGTVRGSSTTPNVGSSSRRGSSVGSTARSTTTTSTKARRLSGLPQPTSSSSSNLSVRKSSIPRASVSSIPSPTTTASQSSVPTTTPTPATRVSRRPAPAPTSNKPRWNNSANTNDLDVGHNFKPLSITTPSPYRKEPPPPRASRSVSSTSSLPVPSPLSRATSTSPAPGGRATSRTSSRPGSRLTVSPTPERMRSPSSTSSVLDPPPYSKLRKQASSTGLATTPRSRQSYAGTPASRADQDGSKQSRPGTALGHSSRRSSLIPQPKQSSGGSRSSKLDERPPWR